MRYITSMGIRAENRRPLMKAVKFTSLVLKTLLFFLVITSEDLKTTRGWGGISKSRLSEVGIRERLAMLLLVVSTVLDGLVLYSEP